MNRTEKLLWSIALPGFGQLLNQKYIKGIVFIGLEFLINVQANFNEAIRFSFLGETQQAALITNYQWLMFYPCLYFFALWDAFKDAEPNVPRYSFLPFVSCAYIVTVGLMYSTKVVIGSVFFGPVWFPILSVVPGLLIGFLLQKILVKIQ
ncbi:hypothetical protein [Bacillus sp. CGMCC 1.16541]|uniref:hypothetical protein n=1 Tax=Bacillus sp. CGMCC 1.16541 TaxID=2185143 RepID=UPI000D731D2F|nr:hypothetical protein [Bacillus sp. CGMCC 1.16541]